MTAVFYLRQATTELYSSSALGYVANPNFDLPNIAAKLGISVGSIAGAMAEENTAYNRDTLTFLANWASDHYAQSNFDSYNWGQVQIKYCAIFNLYLTPMTSNDLRLGKTTRQGSWLIIFNLYLTPVIQLLEVISIHRSNETKKCYYHNKSMDIKCAER